MTISFNGGQYLLDAVDVYTAFGYVVTNGKSGILKYPKALERYSYTFPGEKTDYDLSEVPTFEDPQIILRGFIVSNSEADFITKRGSLFSTLKSAQYRVLKSVDTGLEYKVFYVDSESDATSLKVKGTALKAWGLTLILQTVGFDTAIPGTPIEPPITDNILNLDGNGPGPGEEAFNFDGNG